MSGSCTNCLTTIIMTWKRPTRNGRMNESFVRMACPDRQQQTINLPKQKHYKCFLKQIICFSNRNGIKPLSRPQPHHIETALNFWPNGNRRRVYMCSSQSVCVCHWNSNGRTGYGFDIVWFVWQCLAKKHSGKCTNDIDMQFRLCLSVTRNFRIPSNGTHIGRRNEISHFGSCL